MTRVGDRHVFQSGGRGGVTPDEVLRRPDSPPADDESPEAEWGGDPQFSDAVAAWCAANGHPCIRITPDGPQKVAHPVAVVLREWTRERGGDGNRMIVPSFVLGDPWRTIETGRVPFWTYFPVTDALESLDAHLARAEPYRSVDVLLFQHGTQSPRIMTPEAVTAVVRRHGATPRLVAVDPRRSPHDIGSLARYGPALARVPDGGLPFTPLPVPRAVEALGALETDRGRPRIPSVAAE